MSKDLWWNGDVFITHDDYAIDLGTCKQFLDLGKDNTISAFNYEDISLEADLALYERVENYKGYPIDMFFIDSVSAKGYKRSYVGCEKFSYSQPWGKGDRFLFNWENYVAREKNVSTPKTCFLSEAVMRDFFRRSKRYSEDVLVHNKKLKKKDTYPLVDKPESSNKQPQGLFVHITEGVNLEDTLNDFLFLEGRGLVPFIIENVFRNKLQPYDLYSSYNPKMDSLKKMSIIDFDNQLRVYLDVPYFSLFNDMKGDFKKGDSIMYQNDYYRAKSDVIIDSWGGFNKEEWDKFKTSYYPFDQLDVLQLIYKQSFDENGKIISYTLEGLTFLIPFDLKVNIKGIELPVCTVKWNELKPLLETQHPNMVSALNNREMFSYFFKTSVLKASN